MKRAEPRVFGSLKTRADLRLIPSQHPIRSTFVLSFSLLETTTSTTTTFLRRQKQISLLTPPSSLSPIAFLFRLPPPPRPLAPLRSTHLQLICRFLSPPSAPLRFLAFSHSAPSSTSKQLGSSVTEIKRVRSAELGRRLCGKRLRRRRRGVPLNLNPGFQNNSYFKWLEMNDFQTR